MIGIRGAVQSLGKAIPKLCCSESTKDPIVWVRFYAPWNGWAWYVIEYDGNDTFYGYAEGIGAEFGYFSLSELEDASTSGTVRIVRDTSFRPTRLSNVRRPKMVS